LKIKDKPKGAKMTTTDTKCRYCEETCKEQGGELGEFCLTYDNTPTCRVCDSTGCSQQGGEFGELCLTNGKRYFEPSDPRDLDEMF